MAIMERFVSPELTRVRGSILPGGPNAIVLTVVSGQGFGFCCCYTPKKAKNEIVRKCILLN